MNKERNEDDEALLALAKPTINKKAAEFRRKEQLSNESYNNKVSKPEVIRDTAEKHKRARLNKYRCIILRTGNAEVCHIVPFSVNSKEEYRSKMAEYFTRTMGCMFHFAPGYNKETMDIDNDDPEAWEEPLDKFTTKCRKIFTLMTDISDKTWNEISLNRQLYK